MGCMTLYGWYEPNISADGSDWCGIGALLEFRQRHAQRRADLHQGRFDAGRRSGRADPSRNCECNGFILDSHLSPTKGGAQSGHQRAGHRPAARRQGSRRQGGIHRHGHPAVRLFFSKCLPSRRVILASEMHVELCRQTGGSGEGRR